ncbi:hypothetical protein [Streptomyces sirii]|uniref:hypothetical protein n=1 Tax=Streptomyces sirii TaxID=3127701 RepID=UPI003D35CA0D
MNTLTVRLHVLRPASAVVATVTAVALLLTGCSGASKGMPACHTVRSKGGDLVPTGSSRPCVVYGTKHSTSGHRTADGGAPAAPVVGGSNANRNQAKPKTPATPKVPAVKAPVPAFKAPSLVKSR